MYLAAAAIEIAHDVALIFIGRFDFDFHHGLKQLWTSFFHGVTESVDTSHLEGHFRGIHIMEGAVEKSDFKINNWVATDRTIVGSFADAFKGGLDKFFWDHPTDCLIDDFNACTAFERLKLDTGVAVLTAATSLADEFTLPL